MKKVYSLFLSLGVVALASTGCKTAPQKSGVDSSAVDSAAVGHDTLTVDSMAFSAVGNDSTAECFIRVDYPYGSDSLSLGVKEFIGGELAAQFMPYNNEEESVARKYPRYKGGVLKGQQMVDHYGKTTMKYFGDSQESTMKEMGWGEEDRPKMSQELNIRKSDETSKYVTYHISDFVYLGGAHPSYTSYSVNISKLTNKPVAQMVDSTKLRALQPLLSKGVLSYLKLASEDVTAKNFKSSLFLPESGLIPLPVHTPYLKGDSVCFVYQQYEIASYAMGLVSFNVAVKDIKKYLCKDAIDLVE